MFFSSSPAQSVVQEKIYHRFFPEYINAAIWRRWPVEEKHVFNAGCVCCKFYLVCGEHRVQYSNSGVSKEVRTGWVAFVSGIFAEGNFADGIFAEGIFAERNFCRKKFSPNGVFAEWKYRRTEISPTEFLLNGIFTENQGMLISQVNFRIYAVFLFYC